MNVDDHERRGRCDVHDRVFLNCRREDVRENGHAHARGYGQSQSRGHAGGCAGADVRGSLSCCLQYLESCLSNTLAKYITVNCRSQIDSLPQKERTVRDDGRHERCDNRPVRLTPGVCPRHETRSHRGSQQ